MMEPDHFIPLLNELTGEHLALTARVRADLLGQLAAIGAARAGVVDTPHSLPAADVVRWEQSVVREALQEELDAFARDVRRHLDYREALPPRVLVNTASVDTLEGLPGIGRQIAERIVTHRLRYGPFRSHRDLDRVPGLGDARLEAIADRIDFAEPAPVVSVSSELWAFASTASVESYRSLVERGSTLLVRDPHELRSHVSGADSSPGAAVVAFIGRVRRRAEAQADAFAETSEADIESRLRTLDQFDSAWKASEHEGLASILLNDDYIEQAERLIRSARESIDVTMFLARLVDDDEQHPVRRLVDALLSHESGGVQIRVILDQDETTDPFHSREINEAAVARLRAAGIPVKQDEPDVLTHTKMLLVDGHDCIVGSHNWTWSSFNRYAEVSLLLRDTAIASRLRASFERLWTSLPA